MTLQVLILLPVRPGVTPRPTLTPLLHQNGRRPFCGLHSPLGVLCYTLWISSLRGCGPEHVFPFWGHLHTAHGSLGWAALRPFPMLDLLGLFKP